MTAAFLVTLLTLGLVVSAVLGPWVLRQAAPALMRLPRLAIILITGSIAAWVLTLLAWGPMLAWFVSGPAVLSGGAAELCQRCLAAANPFTASPIDTAVPVVVFLALSAVGTMLYAVSIIVEAQRRHRSTLRTARQLRAHSEPRQLCGDTVLVVDDPHPFAFTLPRRHGGIIVSVGALDILATDELAAVLAHEQAHLRQRHHFLSGTVASLTRRLRWVPLLAAAEDALGHYLEIAADDTARRRVGTSALASALLILSQSGRPTFQGAAVDGALHVLGPDRVRRLVQPRSGMAGMFSAAATVCCIATLAFLSAAVHVPYALAAFTGCA